MSDEDSGSWRATAKCAGQTELMYDEERIEEARALCIGCSHRTVCCDDAMNWEPAERFGIWGATTGPQRTSIAQRGGLRDADPLPLIDGYDTARNREVPPILDTGDNWSRHHTTLARKVVRWLVDNVSEGATLPPQAHICKSIGCSSSPLRRVLDALVADGTLDVVGRPERQQGDNGTTRTFVRAHTPRVISSWLPIQLRHSMNGDSA